MAYLSSIRRLLKLVHPEGIPWPGSVLYNAISSTAMFQHHYELVSNDILSYCKEGRLLDIGTGPGRLLLTLHQKAPQIKLVGIDSSPAMVTKARENIAGTESIEIKQGSAGKIPFSDNCFDIIISTASIHHWKQPTEGLNEIYRVLKNDCFALIYDLVSDTPPYILADCKREFGKFKTTLFWLHSFEEPFYNQHNFKALAKSTSFKKCQTQFLGLLYCLILKKGHS